MPEGKQKGDRSGGLGGEDTIMRKTGKRNLIIVLAAVLVLTALTLTACGKSEFGMSENTEKKMVIKAENADRKSFFMVGTLTAADGDHIVITPKLSKGSVRVELVGVPEEQSIDKIPEMDGKASFTADVSGTEDVSGMVPAGSYMLRATCLEKATGTIEIEVKPAS